MSADADARPRAYRLLSRLFLGGPAAADLPTLADVPDLAPHLPSPFAEDEAAADHHRVFEREVLPYASVFLEADGCLGGDVTASVVRRFGSAGEPLPTSEAADHLGHELALLAVLEEGRSAGTQAEAGAVEEIRTFLDGHLLWWLPSLLPALGRNGSRFWEGVGGIGLELVLDHRAAVAGDGPPGAPPPWSLQGVPRDPLDDPRVGLREVATFLVLPARSGLYLSEADARDVGRAQRLPGGFGGRARVLETVLHSAVAYEGMDEVAAGLLGLVEDVARALDASVAAGLHAAFVDPWSRRLEATARMLARMREGEGPVA